MKIRQCSLRTIKIPFKILFKHSLFSSSEVDSIIVEIETESGITGYGEAIPREFVTGETTHGVKENLIKYVFPKLIGMRFPEIEDLIEWVESFLARFPEINKRELCVKTGIELALLDAAAKESNISVLELLGGAKGTEITYSGIVSAESTETVTQILIKYKSMGINQIKIKTGNNIRVDLNNIKQANRILGEEASVRIDVNANWDLQTAKKYLPKFIDLGVVSVEQPIPVRNREDYPRLNKFLNNRMELCVDESLCTFEEGMWLAKNKGATVFNLRVSKNGGIYNCLKLYKLAKQMGIKCQLGAQVGETSLLSSAGRILGLTTGDFLFHEGSFGTHLLSYDLTDEPIEFSYGGKGSFDPVVHRNGLGVKINEELLSKMTISMYSANTIKII
jgi:L-Ala-D/L-Glu epimerase